MVYMKDKETYRSHVPEQYQILTRRKNLLRTRINHYGDQETHLPCGLYILAASHFCRGNCFAKTTKGE